jgi:hypothetical protein
MNLAAIALGVKLAGLSRSAIRTYKALRCLAQERTETDVTDRQLASQTGLRRRSVQLGLTELDSRGLISRRRLGAGGRRIITLLDFPDQAAGQGVMR